MIKENERKFLVKNLPDLTNVESCKIKQWYLSKPGDLVSTRIRQYDDGRCYLDLKKGIGISRYEKGFKCDFKEVKIFTETAPYVYKTRYRMDYDDYVIFIDIFHNGLKLIEVEGELSAIKSFEPLDWFGKEVTDDVNYTNNYIAYKYFEN